MKHLTLIVLCNTCQKLIAKTEGKETTQDLLSGIYETMKKHSSSCNTDRFSIYQTEHLMEL